MQVLTALCLVCLLIILIGTGITIYGGRKNELFCLITGPVIMVIGLGIIIYTACLLV